MTNPKSEIRNPKFAASADAKIAAVIGAFALLLTCIPYIVGYFAAGKNHFLWLGANVDDANVYFSWIRQGETDSLHQINRFTTDPQPGLFANPLFLGMGLAARVLHLSPAAVYHLARIGFGAALLIVVWKFIGLVIPNTQPGTENAAPDTRHATADTRIFAFLFVCFASGLGWLPIDWTRFAIHKTCPAGPIDLWQPEAITFLSLYLAPLFLASMCLQIAILALLLRGRGIKDAIGAGLCGLLLSVVHSYDVLSIGAVWLTYLIVAALSRNPKSKIQNPKWIYTGLAAAITLPGVLLMALQLKNNGVFRARANVETLSTYPQWLLIGYGLTLAFAIYGVYVQSKTQYSTPNTHSLLLVVWGVVNAAVAYIPHLAFQRKLLQGEHFPIAILAGIGAAALITKYQPIKGTVNNKQKTEAPEPIQNTKFKIQNSAAFNTRRPMPNTHIFAAGLLTLLLGLTNLQYLLNETERFQNRETKIILARPYLLHGEVEALNWIVANSPKDAAIQPLPWQTLIDNPQTGRRARVISDITLALATPGITDRAVYCGHWGETPDYPTRLTQDLGAVALGVTPDEKRIEILRKMNVSYLIFSQKDPADAAADLLFPQFRGHIPLPSYLVPVYSNPDADVYAVHLP